MLFFVLCVIQCLFTSQVVVSGDRLDSNLVYFFCNPTGVLPFVSVSAILMLNCVYVFLPVKSINEINEMK